MKKNFALIAVVLTFALSAAPDARGQWVCTNWPYDSIIKSLAVSDSTLFAGTNGDGVFLSTDNGLSWSKAIVGITEFGSINAIGVNGTNIFAGSQDEGVFLSTDNGASWTTSNNALSGSFTTAFAVIDTNIFAGTYGGGVFS